MTGPCAYALSGTPCGVDAPIRPDRGNHPVCDFHAGVLDLMADALLIHLDDLIAQSPVPVVVDEREAA